MQAWTGICRGLALFLSVFTALNIVGELRAAVAQIWLGQPPSGRFTANVWWIDLRPWPSGFSGLLLAVSAVVIAAAALKPVTTVVRARVTRGVLVLLLMATLSNTWRFWQLTASSEIISGFPLPFSGLVSLVLIALLASPWFGPHAPDWSRAQIGAALSTVLCCGIACPVAQMYCFGRTDYRRPADVAVIFGAKVFADGTPSLVLWDRVRTGCELYQQGLVQKLVLSGGPGSGPIDETQAMAKIAREAGVPEHDLVLDPHGLNTHLTVEHTIELARQSGWRRILAVSHGYHLPRIKLTFHRARCEVYTVPARESRRLIYMTWYMTREVAALWAYYLEPLKPV